MSTLYFPGSDSVTQNFSKKFPGSLMRTNVLVWHSTEGVSWPGYQGGAVAPNVTVFLSIKERRMYVRSHYPWDRSSRALENRSGGVETNTLNSFQVEVIGTCDPRYRYRWGTMVAGVDYFYLPDMPQWALELLAEIPAWLHEVSPGFPIKDAAPRGWLPYPSSYGTKNGQRLSFAEWNNTYGMVGHQHVPENSHGDPGNFNIAAVVAAATGKTVPDVPPVIVPPVAIDPMDPKNYYIGAKGDYITEYGKRIELWSAALGLQKPYQIGPGPSFTATDQIATQRIQRALGYGSSEKDLAPGGNSDGFPGKSTLAALFSTPTVATKPEAPQARPTLTILSNNLWGYGGADSSRTQAARLPLTRPMVAEYKPDVICFQELSNQKADRKVHAGGKSAYTPLAYMDAKLEGYTRVKAGSDGRYIYIADGIKFIAGMTVQMTPKYDDDDKQAALVCLEKDGVRFTIDSFHTENQGSDDKWRIGQLQSLLRAHDAFAEHLGVDEEHRYHAGDANDRDNVLAKAFKPHGDVDGALVAKSSTNASYKSAGVYGKAPKGERIDLICVPKGTLVLWFKQIIDVPNSDHNPQLLVIQL